MSSAICFNLDQSKILWVISQFGLKYCTKGSHFLLKEKVSYFLLKEKVSNNITAVQVFRGKPSTGESFSVRGQPVNFNQTTCSLKTKAITEGD